MWRFCILDQKRPRMTEHLITITLSPQLCMNHRIKGQLKHSYKHMIEAFNSGMGCLEFTSQGNCHYHIKTQDDMSDILVFLDKLKGVTTLIDSKKVFVFGFTKCDKTKNQDMIGNYDYIEKSFASVDQTLKKLNLSDKYKSLWVYKPKKTKFNVNLERKSAYDHMSIDAYDNASSDTLDCIITQGDIEHQRIKHLI